ncbi:MAG: carbohydrate-binding protein [Saprospiraceae bacterium]
MKPFLTLISSSSRQWRFFLQPMLTVFCLFPMFLFAQVNLGIKPTPVQAKIGDTFSVTVEVQAGTQLVDLAEVHLNFNPAVIRVKSITPTGPLTALVLVPASFDNINGTIDYAAGVTTNFPSGTFNFVIIECEAIANGISGLTFNKVFPRETQVTGQNGSGGSAGNVMGNAVDGSVTVGSQITCASPNIPGLLQAESFASKSTSIALGNGNTIIQSISNGTFVEYDLCVAATCSYTIQALAASATTGGFIDFKINGTIVSTMRVQNTGAWAKYQLFTSTANLTEGVHKLRLEFRHPTSPTATGFLMNLNSFVFAAAANCSVCNNNAAPELSITAPANNAGFTQGNAVNFTGTANDTKDGNLSSIISWSSNVNGNLGTGASISTSNLSVGTHTITAIVTDGCNAKDSAKINIIVNAPTNTAPVINITAPGNNSAFIQGTAINFMATATDAQDGSLSANINWVSNRDGNLGTGSNLSRSNLTLGLHTITASVTDSDGMTATATISVTVNPVGSCNGQSIPGTLQAEAFTSKSNDIRLESNGTTLGGIRGSYFLEYNICVNQTCFYDINIIAASNANGGFIDVKIDGRVVDTIRTTYTGGWQTYQTFSGLAELTEGTHTLRLEFRHPTNPTSFGFLMNLDSYTLSATPNCGACNNNTAPVIAITAPANNTGFNVGAAVNFTATATDAQDGNIAANVTWSSSRDGNLGTGATISRADLTVGTHTITASVTDACGVNRSTSITVIINEAANAAPSVTITAPNNNASFTEGSSINFKGTSTDAEDGNLSASITWSSNRDGSLGTGANLSRANLSVGTHVITAKVTDSDGATGQASITIVINEVPNAAPSVTITAPNNNATFTAGTTINFTGTATDAEDGNLSASINWSSNRDGNLGTGASLSRANLSVGTHVITAKVMDSDGATGQASITIVINEVPNATPSVTITAPNNNATFTEGTSINFKGTATDAEDGNLSASINWSSNRDGNLGTGASLSRANLSVGTHVITAKVTDSDGATGQASITIQIEPVSACIGQDIPGTIEAESFVAKSSTIFTEVLSGVLGFITTGTFAEYDLCVAEACSYSVQVRAAAALVGGIVDFEIDGNKVGSIRVTSTGQYNVFKNFVSTFSIPAGSHKLRLVFRHPTNPAAQEVLFRMDHLTFVGNADCNAVCSDNRPPTVTISAPENNSVVNVGTPIRFYAIANDAEQGNVSYNIQWTSDKDGNLGTGSIVNASLTAGTHIITASVGDICNAQATASIKVTVAQSNTAPVVIITAPANNASYNEGTPIQFKGNATDAEDGNISAWIQWRSNLDGTLGTGASLTIVDLSVGTHTITAKVTDDNGASKEAAITVKINRSGGGNNNCIAVPGTVQAEAYTRKSDNISLISNGRALGSIRGDNFTEFTICAARACSYPFVVWAAAGSSNTGIIDFKIGSTVLKSITIDRTGGWDEYESFSGTINLPAGKHTLRLEYRNARNGNSNAPLFNLDRIVFGACNNGDNDDDDDDDSDDDDDLQGGVSNRENGLPAGVNPANGSLTFTATPNPGHNEVQLQIGEPLRQQNFTVRVADLTGKIILQRYERAGGNLTLYLDASQLTPGLYLITIVTDDGLVETQKWVKQ